MALTATVYTFDIDLADHDRGVYDTLALRVARHPSESDEYLVTRLLAFVLEYVPGIEFSSGGLGAPEDPPVTVRDLTGAIRTWVDVGWPDAARLHKASKAAPRVVVYPHREVTQWLRRLEGARIHRAEAIDVRAIDLGLIDALAARLDRRVGCAISVSGDELFVSMGEHTLSGAVVRHGLP